jgi:DNA polymerase-3 subunit alpha
MLGLYVSDHPLAGREDQLARYAHNTIGEITSSETLQDGESVIIAGLVTQVLHKVARQSGNPYAAVTVEDFEGEMQVMLMGKTYQEYAKNLETDQVVMIRGNISQRDDGNSLRANSIETIEGGADFIRGPVVLRVPEAEATREILEELDRILQVHTGSEEVQVKLVGEVGERLFKLQPRVKITSELYGELKVLLGSKCLT